MLRRPLGTAAVLILAVCVIRSLLCPFDSGKVRALAPAWVRTPEGQEITLTGVAADCILTRGGTRIILEVNDDLKRTKNWKVTFYREDHQIEPGDRITVRGICAPFSPAENPGQFDREAYYLKKRIAFSVRDPVLLKQEKLPVGIRTFLHRFRFWMFQSYRSVFGERHAAALAAITLGEKELMETEQKTLYQEGGIAHIFAVSGLHISLLGIGFYLLLRKCCLPGSLAALIAGAGMAAYIEMVGWSASAVRAGLMFAVWLAAGAGGFAYDPQSALYAAGCVMLAADPLRVMDADFQMSFLAILSVHVLFPAFRASFSREREWLSPLACGWCIQAGMLPCVVFFYYQITPVSIFLNLAVIPFMSLVMLSALAGGLIYLIWPAAGIFISAPCHYLLAGFDFLCHIEQAVPYAVWVRGRPPVWTIVLYAALLLAAVFMAYLKTEKRKKFPVWMLPALWVCIFAAGPLLLHAPAPKDTEITCLSVGQGDGIAIRTAGQDVLLIDGGSSSENGIWKNRMGSFLRYHGISDIDWWFVSHTDQDHISALEEFLSDYRLNLSGKGVHGITLHHLVFPVTEKPDAKAGELAAMAEKAGIRVHRMQRGDRVSSGNKKGDRYSWEMEAVAPDLQDMTGDKNQDSLVLRLRYDNFRMLFTGDLEGEGEEKLVRRKEDLRADILKVGHHGSRNATSLSFLTCVSPQAAVISAGRNNSYGHPHAETLKRLSEEGIRTYRTDERGAVIIRTGGNDFSIHSFTCFLQEVCYDK